ncbi:hypothetical protein KSP40_PGU019835 [Platanthera guangdongensis]|uniref:MATH domain-containing protein n=1 Tax=Platanthera guangdongensis TaxID=2320717 RepID=A0ABR2M7Z5_9ASPA
MISPIVVKIMRSGLTGQTHDLQNMRDHGGDGENFGQVQDEMGFRSMIDLKTFRDSSNGYLVKDSCMFGVKIFQMVPIQTPTECMHPVEKVSHDYSWKIENFSKLDKKTSHEKKFTAGDYLWSGPMEA